MKNVWAYTPSTNEYPEYISINETEMGEIEITIRASKLPPNDDRPYVLPGTTAVIRLPRAEITALIAALRRVDGYFMEG